VAKYKELVADHPNVEMIHVSLDSSKSEHEAWAAREKFPWPTVLPERVKKSKLRQFKTTRAVPEYHLIDSEGNTVVKGTSGSYGAFDKIKELKEASASVD